MSRLAELRRLISQRLSAAVDDILGHCERTIREYEEEAELRHRRLLDGLLTADTKQRRAAPPADVQQVLVNSEQLHQENQRHQEDQQDSYIKEEQEEVWANQRQLRGLQKVGVTKLPSSPGPVKSEEEEEKPQSSQLYHHLSDPAAGGPEPVWLCAPERHLQPVGGGRASDSDAETEVSDGDCKRSQGPDLDSVKRDDAPGKKSFVCCQCGRKFGRKDSLRRHTRYHTGERPYSCSVCGKSFSQRPNLIRHMRCHSGEKPFGCSFCGASFAVRSALVNHMRIHTGEKPFSCPRCTKSFTQKGGLKKHMTVHTGEKPYGCPVCHKSFSQKANLTYHFSVHTGRKQFSCGVCHRRFTWQSQVKSHKCVGESSAQ